MLACTRLGRIPVRLFSTTSIGLSGHSKWSTIKHDKAKNDAQKNIISSRCCNAIAVAAKLGGINPETNFRLATAIEQAYKNNVQKRAVEAAIKRGGGVGNDKGIVESAVYEGIGPGGVSFVVESLTDNKSRTISVVRSTFAKYGGSISPTLFQFDRRGLVVIEKGESNFDDIFERVIDLGAEDVEDVEDCVEVITEPNDTSKIAEELRKEFKVKELGIVYIPKDDLMVEINDEDTKIKYDKLVAALEDVADITDYYSNLKE